MARIRKNEAVPAKRRVKVYIVADDGVTPAPASTTFAAVAAFVALTGTHHATLTALTAGTAKNGVTIALASDGTGAGSLTVSGGTNYTFHFQSGTTTMANFVTAAAAVFAFSGHTPADVLAAGDVQGPLTFAGGVDRGWGVASGSPNFATAGGIITNVKRENGTNMDGAFEYEFTQAETNVTASELQLKLEYPGFKTMIETVDQNDAADFDALGEGSNTYGDMFRLAIAVLAGKVQDFTSGSLAFKSLDGTKTRLTALTSALGRIATTIGDLTS